RVARATETGEHLDTHRIVGQPLAEGASVLLGEDRGGREHCHLLPRLRRLEGRPQRDLGLAVSYVADQQPVHRSGALHVTLHLLGGATLVGSILVQRSEEHTSELQSRGHLVCRLLLEKKNGVRAIIRNAVVEPRRGKAYR